GEMRSAVLVVVGVAGLIVASCGGSDRAGTLEAPPPTTQPTTAPSSAPATTAPTDDTAPSATAATTASTTAPTPVVAEEGDLGEKLLTIEDLPTGWAVSPNDDGSSTGNACDDYQLSDTSTAKAEVTFSQGSFGPFLVEGLARFGDDADDQFDAFIDYTKR